MRRPSQPARLLLALAVTLLAAALVWVLLSATDAALSVWQRLEQAPALLRYAFLGALAVIGVGAGWAVWRLLHPRPARAPKAEPIDRSTLERRVDTLGDAAAQARTELDELDRRRATREVYVALFGEISAGKSSLMKALAPDAPVSIAARGGSTTEVVHATGRLDGDLSLTLADVPGTHQHDGQAHAALARREAARSHALVYVADGDLSRTQDAELRAVAAFGRPLILALNKRDRYDARELAQLLDRLRARYASLGIAVVAVSAGAQVEVTRVLADGREERVLRDAPPQIDALRALLADVARRGAEALEPAREAAVFAGVEAEVAQAEVAQRRQRSEAAVRKYTKRAVIGALAAIAPGSDLVIQGALATGLFRELAAIHGLTVRDVDIDAFLTRAGGLVRTTTSIALAIAGNALKAFPGLGTLGGGIVHAFAYGLIFDSLGRAVAATFEQTRALDRDAAVEAFRARLTAPGESRLALIGELAREALRERRDDARDDSGSPSREARR